MRKRLWAVSVLVLLVAAVIVVLLLAQRSSGEYDDSASLNVSGQRYGLEVVSTARDKSRGLSGRESLAQDRGMLFVYDREAVRCFWMKDMNFPLDIIWLNERHEVVYIEKNLSPDTYPQSFCPERDAMYVIELNAVEVERADIKEGDKLDF